MYFLSLAITLNVLSSSPSVYLGLDILSQSAASVAGQLPVNLVQSPKPILIPFHPSFPESDSSHMAGCFPADSESYRLLCSWLPVSRRHTCPPPLLGSVQPCALQASAHPPDLLLKNPKCFVQSGYTCTLTRGQVSSSLPFLPPLPSPNFFFFSTSSSSSSPRFLFLLLLLHWPVHRALTGICSLTHGPLCCGPKPVNQRPNTQVGLQTSFTRPAKYWSSQYLNVLKIYHQSSLVTQS